MKFSLSLSLAGAAILAAFTGGAEAASNNRRDAAREQHHKMIARDYPTPLKDPFYKAPGNLSGYKPGEVISTRKITSALSGVVDVGDVTQIHYRTTNSEGHPSSSVTTVLQPKQGGKEKMLSYHLWEDSTQRDCAPSYTVLLGPKAPNVKIVGDDVPIWIDFLLSNGISVVLPDYEGPKSALFAGFTAGYAILDSARAVRAALNWKNDAQVAMTGYSEGAHVTAWAANLQPSYAPDLNVVGVTHGGTPIDMELTLKHFDGTSFSGFTIGGIHGMIAAYPHKFKPAVKQYGGGDLHNDLHTITHPPVCHEILRGPQFAGKKYLEMFNVPNGQDIYDWEPFRYVLDRETLWNNKSSVGVGYPKFPRMIYHGNQDDVINFQAVQAYVEQQCAHGADIQFNVYTANAHTAPQLVIGGDLNAMRFILEVFNLNGHTLTKLPCGMPTPSLLNAGTWALDAILGFDIIGSFQRLTGQIGTFQNIGFGPHVNSVNK